MIEHYSFGKLVYKGKNYSSDLIILKDRIIDNWWRKQGHSICMADLDRVGEFDFKLLIVGTGAYGVLVVSDDFIKEMKARGVIVESYETSTAVKKYNKYLSENRNIAGAFHLTC